MQPSKLYRYVPFTSDEAKDRARQTIVDSLLFFASPTAFNDPFESRFRLKADGSIEQWRSLATAHLQETGNPLGALKLTDDFIRGKIPEWQALAESFPDDFRESLRASCAVCCFSELSGDLLMWSHYASGHHGLCLEFVATSANSMFARAEAVTYSPDFPDFNYFETSADERARLAFLKKGSNWIYEKEWRIIDAGAAPGHRAFPPTELAAVICGCQMADGSRKLVNQWIKERGVPLVVRQAAVAKTRYGLEFMSLDGTA